MSIIVQQDATMYSLLYFCKLLCWRLLADANRTGMANTYCVYKVLRYSWWWTADLSEKCRVLYQI